jgi:sortase A
VTEATHVRVRPATTATRWGYGTLGVVGELLITLGVLILGFLVWQLWWTDVVASREQQQTIEQLPWAHPAVPSAAASPGQSAPAAPPVAVPQHGAPPVEAEPAFGTTFATIEVPRWTGNGPVPILEGTDWGKILKYGVGHYQGTAMPGEVGNFAVAGHRTTYGKPFNRIAELQVGDAVVIRTEHTWYVYKVTSTEIVRPSNVTVIAPVPDHPGQTPTERMITMTTCNPMYSASQRYVVHGVLDYWASADDGSVPAELTAAASGGS